MEIRSTEEIISSVYVFHYSFHHLDKHVQSFFRRGTARHVRQRRHRGVAPLPADLRHEGQVRHGAAVAG